MAVACATPTGHGLLPLSQHALSNCVRAATLEYLRHCFCASAACTCEGASAGRQGRLVYRAHTFATSGHAAAGSALRPTPGSAPARVKKEAAAGCGSATCTGGGTGAALRRAAGQSPRERHAWRRHACACVGAYQLARTGSGGAECHAAGSEATGGRCGRGPGLEAAGATGPKSSELCRFAGRPTENGMCDTVQDCTQQKTVLNKRHSSLQ